MSEKTSCAEERERETVQTGGVFENQDLWGYAIFEIRRGPCSKKKIEGDPIILDFL